MLWAKKKDLTMKSSLIYSLLCFSLFLLFNFASTGRSFKTQFEYDLMREEDPNYKIEREKWMEEMHRCSPDINWRAVDRQTRMIKRLQRNDKIEKILGLGINPSNITLDTIADGKMVGEWIERGSNNLAGRMLTCDIDFERGILYNASSGGNIWKTDLNGETWTCINDGYKIGGIKFLKLVDKGSGKRIIAVAGSKTYYTDDEGQTWNVAEGLEAPSRWGGSKRAVITDSNVLYFLGFEWDYDNWKRVSCIYSSEDLGETFDSVSKFQLTSNLCDLWISPCGKSDLYFVKGDTLSKINDEGEIERINIIDISEDFSDAKQIRLQGHYSSDGDTKLVLYFQKKSGDATSLFFESTDEGESWNKLASLDFGPFSSNSFEVSCVNPEALYFGGVNCANSINGGKSWELVNKWGEYYGDPENKLHADIPAIESFENPDGDEILILGTDGGTYVSYDNLQTVENISMYNLNVSQYYSSYSYREDPDKLFAGSQDQGFQRTTWIADNGTHSFQQTISGDYGHLTSSDGGETVWSVYPGFTMVYKDLARPSKTKRAVLDFEGAGGLWMRPVLADPENPNIAYLAGGKKDGGHRVWKLTYSGNKISSTPLDYVFDENKPVSSLEISELNPQLFYAMTKNGDFYYSKDKGDSWTKSDAFDGLGGHYFYGADIAASTVEENTVYIAGSGYSNPAVYVSKDNGVNFTPIDSGLPNTLVYRIAVAPDDEYIFAATAVGAYVYIPDEEKWFDMAGFKAPDQTYWCVEYLPQISTVRFGTYGRGFWDFQIHDVHRIEQVQLVQPADESVEISLDTNLVWRSSKKADKYWLQVSGNRLFNKIIYNNNEITDTVGYVEGFRPNETYYWRVKALKDNYFSPWSNVYKFNSETVEPVSPSITYPPNNGEWIPLMPEFEWDSIKWATKYIFQISIDSNFSEILKNSETEENRYTLDFYLDNSETYYWRVKTFIGNLGGEFTGIHKFTTAGLPPETPVLLSPESGTDKTPLNPLLEWNEQENVYYYELRVARDIYFNNLVYSKTQIQNNFHRVSEDSLESNRAYMWRVKAHNRSGSSEWSDYSVFRTGDYVGVEETEIEGGIIKVSPNPFENNLFISIESKVEAKTTINLFDLLGHKLIDLRANATGGNKLSINLANHFDFQNINSNVFILKITLNDKAYTKKIIRLR